jgi:hypothetical protein
MVTPITILRKRADEALASFATSSGHDPEGVWAEMVRSPDETPEVLLEHLDGNYLWRAFRTLHEAEKQLCR